MRHLQELQDNRGGSGLLFPQLSRSAAFLTWKSAFHRLGSDKGLTCFFLLRLCPILAFFIYSTTLEGKEGRCFFFFFSLFLCYLSGRWSALRMQGEIRGDTWSTGFSEHIDPGAPGESGQGRSGSERKRETPKSSVNARPAPLILSGVLIVRASSAVLFAQSKPWSTAPAARGLSWTAFCSTCWTELGTSSACSAVSANAIWPRNVFPEKEDSTAKTTSLGKLVEEWGVFDFVEEYIFLCF